MNNKEKIKQRLFEILESSRDHDLASHTYDVMIITAIIVGLTPMTVKYENIYTKLIDLVVGLIFILDYIFRIITADYKMGVKNYKAYTHYIFSPMAIIDLLSIIPVFSFFIPHSTAILVFRLLRTLKCFRVIRVFKFTRYTKTWYSVMNVFRRVKKQLIAVIIILMVYIISIAMIMFQVESDLFNNFLDAIYWSTVSITTIGYGDYYPVSEVGKVITIISSLVGVAVIALPTGIITAAYTEEINKKKGKHEL